MGSLAVGRAPEQDGAGEGHPIGGPAALLRIPRSRLPVSGSFLSIKWGLWEGARRPLDTHLEAE